MNAYCSGRKGIICRNGFLTSGPATACPTRTSRTSGLFSVVRLSSNKTFVNRAGRKVPGKLKLILVRGNSLYRDSCGGKREYNVNLCLVDSKG